MQLPIEYFLTGKCKCKHGYDGSDCSLDANQAPVIAGLLDNGLCDERELACSHAYVFGHFFVDSENLTCKLSEFEVSQLDFQDQKTLNQDKM